MTRTVIRVYDRNEDGTNEGTQYVAIASGTWMDDEMEADNMAERIASMPWQEYTSYLVGTAEIEDSEMMWCEILGGEYKEARIDMSRVTISARYSFPWA